MSENLKTQESTNEELKNELLEEIIKAGGKTEKNNEKYKVHIKAQGATFDNKVEAEINLDNIDNEGKIEIKYEIPIKDSDAVEINDKTDIHNVIQWIKNANTVHSKLISKNGAKIKEDRSLPAEKEKKKEEDENLPVKKKTHKYTFTKQKGLIQKTIHLPEHTYEQIQKIKKLQKQGQRLITLLSKFNDSKFHVILESYTNLIESAIQSTTEAIKDIETNTTKNLDETRIHTLKYSTDLTLNKLRTLAKNTEFQNMLENLRKDTNISFLLKEFIPEEHVKQIQSEHTKKLKTLTETKHSTYMREKLTELREQLISFPPENEKDLKSETSKAIIDWCKKTVHICSSNQTKEFELNGQYSQALELLSKLASETLDHIINEEQAEANYQLNLLQNAIKRSQKDTSDKTLQDCMQAHKKYTTRLDKVIKKTSKMMDQLKHLKQNQNTRANKYNELLTESFALKEFLSDMSEQIKNYTSLIEEKKPIAQEKNETLAEKIKTIDKRNNPQLRDIRVTLDSARKEVDPQISQKIQELQLDIFRLGYKKNAQEKQELVTEIHEAFTNIRLHKNIPKKNHAYLLGAIQKFSIIHPKNPPNETAIAA